MRNRIRATPLTRWALGVVGVVLLMVGVVAVFISTNGAGTAALLGIGGGLVLLAALASDLQSIQVPGIGAITFKEAARQAEESAARAERAGDKEAARRLREAPDQIERLAARYRDLRNTQSSGPTRTTAMERLLHEARHLAASTTFDPVDVQGWFESGTPEVRVMALGLMQGDPRLQSANAVIDVMTASQVPFEQYQAIKLAGYMARNGTLMPSEARAMIEAISRFIEREALGDDSDRGHLARRVIAELRPIAARQ